MPKISKAQARDLVDVVLLIAALGTAAIEKVWAMLEERKKRKAQKADASQEIVDPYEQRFLDIEDTLKIQTELNIQQSNAIEIIRNSIEQLSTAQNRVRALSVAAIVISLIAIVIALV